MSHLASADEDVGQNAEQLLLFAKMGQGINARRRSLVNSAGIMLGANYLYDLTRPGLAVYGGIARPEMSEAIQPVVRPMAKVLQVRDYPTGSSIGYNASFVTSTPTRIATLAIGYADGYFRALSGKGQVEFAGTILPVVGRVSMDLLTVNASASIALKEGDWVTINYDLNTISMRSGMSQYELLTALSDRAERIWL